MYFFLYGQDTYSIKEKVEAFRDRFNKDENALFNHVRLDGAKLTKALYLEAALSVPFLMESKLIEITNLILENSDQDLKKYIADNLDKIPQSNVVLFIEAGVPDARTILFKSLNKPKVAQTFPLPDNLSLKRWIKNKVDQSKMTISASAIEKLIAFVGPDLWRLQQEIDKLIAFTVGCEQKEIDEEAVEKLVAANGEAKVFDLIDSLARKNEKESIKLLHQLLDAGENEIYILTMIVFQFRQALSVADLRKKGVNDTEVLKITKVNPYVFRKLAPLLKMYSYEKMENIYHKLALADFEMKSGSNPGLVLDLLLVDICRI